MVKPLRLVLHLALSCLITATTLCTTASAAITEGTNYLSDLAFVRTSTTFGPVERDTANGLEAARDGTPLIIQGVRYAKGLGTHSNATIVFALNGQCNSLQAVVGINDFRLTEAISARGSATFRILVDGVLRFESGVMRGDSPALPIHLDIVGARELVLQTGDGGDGIAYDHVNWADARVACSTVAATPVPVNNAGLEGTYYNVNVGPRISGVMAPEWEDNSAWSNAEVRYSQETTGPRSGRSAQKIEVLAANNGLMQIVNNVSVVSGRVYTASVWLKGESGKRASIVIQRGSAPYNSYVEKVVDLTPQWREIKVSGFVNETTAALLMVRTSQAGTLWVDDASLSYVSGSPAPQPILGVFTRAQFGMHADILANGVFHNPSLESPYRPVPPDRATITGVIADFWQDNSNWADVTVNYAEDTQIYRSGRSSQRIEVRAIRSGIVQFNKDQFVVPGRTYTAGVWLRGTPGMQATLVLREGPEPYRDYATRDVTLNSTWQYVSVTGTVAGARDAVVMIRTGSVGTLWVDDGSLTDAAGDVPRWAWPSASFGIYRTWDTFTTWTRLEPIKGQWQWGLLDDIVNQASQRGQQIIHTLGQSPHWASARPTEVNFYGTGAPAEPLRIEDWRNYVTQVVTRYKGRIQYYEIWNEPNDPFFYSGTAAKMVELAREAYNIIRAIDPQAKVLTPSPYNAGWLDDYLAIGGAQYADIIGYHNYATPPELLQNDLSNVRAVIRARGVPASKPFWHTEAAAGNATTPDTLGAAYLARFYFLSYAFGAERYLWYAWGPATTFCAATTRADGITPTPAARALDIIQQWLIGARILAVTVDGARTWTLHLRMPNGTRGWIMWNPNATVAFTLPADWRLQSARDVLGSRLSLGSATRLNISALPQLLEGSAR